MKSFFRVSRTVIISAVFVLFAVKPLCYAQQPPSIDARIKEMDKVLKLSDKQKEEIKKILTTEQENMAQRAGSQNRPRGGFGMGFGFRPRSDSAIEAVLTPEQATQFRTFRRNQNIDFRISGLDETLKLNDDQKSKIRKILEDESLKTEGMFSQMPDSQEERKALFQKIRDIREESNKAIETVLTPDQAKAYNKMLEDMRSRAQQNRPN